MRVAAFIAWLPVFLCSKKREWLKSTENDTYVRLCSPYFWTPGSCIIRMPTHKIISPTLRYKDEMFSPLRKLKLQKRKKKKHRGRCSGALRQFFISVLSLCFTIVLIKISIRFPVLSFFLSLYLNDFILRTVP